MTRYALLIESSQLTDLDDLPGARADVKLLRAWMKSPEGGSWRDDEIVTLSHPSIDQLEARLAVAKRRDYAFVSFSGHGHHVVGAGFNETRVCINDDEELTASDLNLDNQRCTVLIDACRGLTVLVPQLLLVARFSRALREARATERISTREKFDRLVRSCEKGAIYLYSCSVDQSAAEDRNGQGGLFTLGLVRSAQRWRPAAGRYYSVRNAFNAAVSFTSRENPQQRPWCQPGDRERFFPFAVAV